MGMTGMLDLKIYILYICPMKTFANPHEDWQYGKSLQTECAQKIGM